MGQAQEPEEAKKQGLAGDTETKERLTEEMSEYAIKFEVPPGWEFVSGGMMPRLSQQDIASVR